MYDILFCFQLRKYTILKPDTISTQDSLVFNYIFCICVNYEKGKKNIFLTFTISLHKQAQCENLEN